MKNNIYGLSLFSLFFLFSCSSPNLDTTITSYKSFINSTDYQQAKIVNQKNTSSYLSIDGFKSYQQDTNSQNIKSDFKFQTESNSGLTIDKVLIAETQKQVDQNGTDSVVADYAGKTINLTITGNFDPIDFSEDNFFFLNDTNLLDLTYTGEAQPKAKVLIDDGIILNPISAAKNYLNVSVNTKDLADFYLMGLHKLKVVSGTKTATTMIRIDKPVAPLVSLTPYINKIEILKKENDNNKAMALKLTGANLMLQPKFSYSLVDGAFCPGYITDIISTTNGDVWETVVSLTAQTNFLNKTTHTLDYYTPFGLTHLEFNNLGQ